MLCDPCFCLFASFTAQRYKKNLTCARIFCILHEISMKLQKTNTKKIEKTATRVAVFNLCDVSHIFNYVASCDTIWYTRVPNLILVLAYYLPMATEVATNSTNTVYL